MTSKARIAGMALALLVVVGALAVPSPLRTSLLEEARYRGYLAYGPDEAVTIAYTRCSTCHSADKMLRYCARCGPPFIVVVHSMKKYVELSNRTQQNVRPFSDAEAVAIAQAWNALVGNWESGWGDQNLERLLQGDRALIGLLGTAPEKRPIEVALRNKSAPGAYREQ